ncbi:hypothetical protein CCY99_07125 [Helicobacter sp. 16-1353]|uniref:DUF485 domain-containing protein n=1 Tax=Helicobacter sp. 16-1353 TaxID=2004996 RepID=UPI000DCBF80A|nr:DUF485 domain-containing protein [Helicobacter sp. 16-1353]RAX52732.1 hypothetical protein CCY99_07125 [Helicobacter sp. 16-1353]
MKTITKESTLKRFKKFITFRSKFSLFLTVVILLCYYAFILSVGLFPDVLGYRIGPSSVTLGIALGLLLIFICISITGLYTFVANKYFDRDQREILEEMEDCGILKNGVLQDDKIQDAIQKD